MDQKMQSTVDMNTQTNMVMKTQANDYRIERWMAFLLGLLFLLPFVVR